MDFERERKKEDAGIYDKDIHYTESETEDVSDNQNNQTRLDYETNNQNSNEYKNNNNDENQEIKKLYRSKDNIMLAGVCSGIAEYFNIDPTLVRLGFVIFGFATNIFSLLAYIIMSAIIPKRP